MKRQTVTDIVRKLQVQTIGSVEEFISKNKSLEKTYVQTVLKVHDFRYGEGATIVPEERSVSDIYGHEVVELVDGIIASSLFEDASRLLQEYYKVESETVDRTLKRFLAEMSIAVCVGPPRVATTKEAIMQQLFDDLSGADPHWVTNCELTSLTIDVDSVSLDNSTILRRSKASDYERIVHEFISSIELWTVSRFWCVVESTIRSSSPAETQRHVTSIPDCLALFKTSSVDYYGYTMIADSLNPSGGYVKKSHVPGGPVFKLNLTAADAEVLPTFWEALHPRVKELRNGGFENADDIHNAIALDRYLSCVRSTQTWDGKIAAAISTLEALLLKPKEMSELSHRLAQRTAQLLNLLGEEPLKVFKEVKLAYEVRSRYVHGASHPSNDSENSKLAHSIINYARLVLTTMIQISGKGEKDSIIGKIDRSLLHDKSKDRLAKQLKGSWNSLTHAAPPPQEN